MSAAALSKYLRVANIGMQNTFVYRWNFLARASFGIVPLVGTVFIWRAIFGSREDTVAGYDFATMVFYFLCVMLVENLVSPAEDDWQIAAEIREGQISALLIKPMNHLLYRTGLFLSARVVYAMVTLPIVGLLFWWYREYVQLPSDPVTWVLAGVSVAMAAFIQFFIAYALAMMAFWVLEISTLVFIFYSFEYFLSGHMFPVDVMPQWLQDTIRWLPFPYELYFPVAVFLERVKGEALWSGLAIQAAWVLLMALLCRWLWRRGVQRYEAVGG